MPAFVIKAVTNGESPLFAKVAAHTGKVSGWTRDVWEAKHFVTQAAAQRVFDCLRALPSDEVGLPPRNDLRYYEVGVYRAEINTSQSLSPHAIFAGKSS